jgi:hypothetical protein
MRRRDFLATAGSRTALFAAAQVADEPGFVSLFDGNSLAGWSVVEAPESAFYVGDGSIVVHHSAGYPTWLRSARQYENFDFRGEFFVKGWADSGIYVHAPEHGRAMWAG